MGVIVDFFDASGDTGFAELYGDSDISGSVMGRAT